MGTEPVRIESDVKERIEEVHDGDETMSETASRITRVGLREVQGPVSQHVRDMAFDAAYHLTLLAVVLVVLGFWPGIIGAASAVAIALVVMTVAMAPVAGLEVVRAVGGQSEMGSVLRGEDA